MPASITDKLRLTRTAVGRPVATYLTAQKGIGAASATVNALTNWATSTAVDFVIYRKDANGVQVGGTLTTWKGIASGTTISNLTLVAGTDQVYAGDENSVVVATPTSEWSSDLIAVLIGLIDQDGTLKAGAVDNAAVLASDVVTTAKILDANVTTAKIADNNVTAAKLATNAITLGYAQITSNFTTTNTTATQVTSLTSTVTIPAGGRRVRITAFTRALYNSNTGVGAIITIWDGTVGSGTQLSAAYGFQGGGTGATSGFAVAVISPAAGSKTYNVGLQGAAAGTSTIEAAATYPAFILVETI